MFNFIISHAEIGVYLGLTAAAALTSLGSDKSFRGGDAVAMAMESQAH
jgi:hypothetical protein